MWAECCLVSVKPGAYTNLSALKSSESQILTKELLLQSGPLTHRQRLFVKAVVHFVPAAMLRPRNEFPMVGKDEVV